jgi:hypothetical protein
VTTDPRDEPSRGIDADAPADASIEARPLFVPRGLVMLAAIWVFLSWVMLFGFRPPVQPQAASYGPSLEMLFVSIGIGISIGWPLLRLSARPSAAPVLQALFDGLAIFVLLQVVAWPLRLVSSWTLPRTWLVIASMAACVAFSGGVLALAQASFDRRARTRAMAFAVAAALLPIMIGIAGEAIAPTGSPMFDSPPADAQSSWRWMVEAVAPASGPCLLARASEPIPLDPKSAEWGLLRPSAVLSAVVWMAALVVRARRPIGSVRSEGPVPLS